MAYIPFAFIHFYPYLLKSLNNKDNKKEAKRLENLFMNYGINQAKNFKTENNYTIWFKFVSPG